MRNFGLNSRWYYASARYGRHRHCSLRRQSTKKFPMNHTFGNVYEDEERARAYATLQFPGTYYLAFRDLPALIRHYNHGSHALDFGCGTGRSTRFLRNLGLNVIGADISQAMLDQARTLDPSGEYHLFRDNIAGGFAPGSLMSFWLHSRSITCQLKRRRTP
jgi:SAM-dependent methyltransferase